MLIGPEQFYISSVFFPASSSMAYMMMGEVLRSGAFGIIVPIAGSGQEMGIPPAATASLKSCDCALTLPEIRQARMASATGNFRIGDSV